MTRSRVLRIAQNSVLTLILATLALPGVAQQPNATERAAQLKANLEASQAVLKQYEWIETTAVSLKGDEKSRKQARCYYGADGGLQKVEVNSTPPPEKKRGLRGEIASSINGKMIGGFALVAWPAEYGATGTMTFIVNQQGRVYQNDPGPNTAQTAVAMKSDDPDKTWRISPD